LVEVFGVGVASLQPTRPREGCIATANPFNMVPKNQFQLPLVSCNRRRRRVEYSASVASERSLESSVPIGARWFSFYNWQICEAPF
jgi:hypothetical protein